MVSPSGFKFCGSDSYVRVDVVTGGNLCLIYDFFYQAFAFQWAVSFVPAVARFGDLGLLRLVGFLQDIFVVSVYYLFTITWKIIEKARRKTFHALSGI